MSAGATEICNLALLHLGEDSISSLSEESQAARVCNRIYDVAREEVLRLHPWQFATRTATLAQLAETPARWSFAYALPSGCLKFLGLVSAIEGETLKFELQNDKIFTNEGTPLTGLFVFDETDTAKFDSQFRVALSHRIASLGAKPITQKNEDQQAQYQLFLAAMPSARSSDNQEAREEQLYGQTIVGSRQ